MMRIEGVLLVLVLAVSCPPCIAAEQSEIARLCRGDNGKKGLTHSTRPFNKVLVAGGVGAIGSGTMILDNAEVYDMCTKRFTSTGRMAVATLEHTATLLTDRSILIAGGNSNLGTTSSAELYDIEAGHFEPTGSMTTPRVVHTATLLKDGNVLIAGGNSFLGGQFDVLASAELYLRDKKQFVPTGKLHQARQFHTATLLPNGQVLVAGGVGPEETVTWSSAELYDPSSGLFTETGSLHTARSLHTATPLADGRVLFVGGEDVNGFELNSAELYNPATRSFGLTGSMTQSRVFHTATRLCDGTVLITGGVNGGSGPTVFLNSTEIYQPDTGLFHKVGNMLYSRRDHSATLLADCTVLITTGETVGLLDVQPAELYHPSTESFVATGDLITSRDSNSVTGFFGRD